MLTEKTRNKALEAFLKGRKVIVMTVFEEGSIAAEKLEDILMTEGSHYLVDVQAVENPEFKQAVADMTKPDQKQDEPSGEESITPPSTGPEVSEVPSAKRGNGNQEKARELAEQGMSASEIAAELGIKYNTVYYYLHPEKHSRKRKAAQAKKPASAVRTEAVGKPGWNQDRHACQSCQYRSSGQKGCDYYLLTDKERGCDPADCDKYVRG